MRPRHKSAVIASLAALILSSCVTPNNAVDRTATIVRTANGVAHISAPDPETLAYGAAYAYAQDNVCQTANSLVTLRAERSRYFGAGVTSQFGLRYLTNEQIDLFIVAHMDDAALKKSWQTESDEARALARGTVDGYNRYLVDHRGALPNECNDQPWVKPMSLAELRRSQELAVVLASSAAFAEAIVSASPPKQQAVSMAATVDLADARSAIREMGLLDLPLGSNAWAFGKEVTADGSGLLLGNPHFPWTGTNRFWEMHLTIPGKLDVMGAGIGLGSIVVIGFNNDVAWSHTVSTGKRFTLYELSLAPEDPTVYLIDGQPERMVPKSVQIHERTEDGSIRVKTQTVWSTRWGPVIVIPRAGLNWTTTKAYALKDVNTGNVRGADTWLGFARSKRVEDMAKSMSNIGLPWVNTIAADRHGNVLYADAAAVPDVDRAQLERCAPSKPAAALRAAAGLVVLDGSTSHCAWHEDPTSPVPGVTPIARMPLAVRSDWVQNSNDSFYYTHPGQRFEGISPLVGEARITGARTRAGLTEIPEMIARGKVTSAAVQFELFQDRNFMAGTVLPDLIAACSDAPTPDSRDGCVVLGQWDRRNGLEARGAHLFREFLRPALAIPHLYRVPYDPDDPVRTPYGLNMADPVVAAKVWAALDQAVKNVRSAGFALDATLGSIQHPAITEEAIPLHGGDNIEGVLNNLGREGGSPGISKEGLLIDFGTSYVQTVTFDSAGPVAHAILTYGQSTDPTSPHATDQLRLFSQKTWPRLPFHPADIEKERVGPVLLLVRQ